MPEPTGEITLLLQKWRDGSAAAEDELFARVMPNLRRLAHYLMMRERKGHTLQPTELVDQIYLRMVSARDRDWQSRGHFFAIAARAMRRTLIDHARARPDVEIAPLDGMRDLLPADSMKLDRAIHVDRLLHEMAQVQPEWCSLVEMKYFLGLNDEEVADALGLKLRTMQRMWHEARQWLFERIEGGNAGSIPGR